jgi:two-component system, OmpR family, sensor histidine kinase VicK
MEEKRKQEIFDRLITTSSKVAFIYDVGAGTVAYLNDAFSAVWRRTPESAMADPCTILGSVHPDDVAYLTGEYQGLLRGELKHNVEFRITRPDKSVRCLLCSPRLVRDSEGRLCVTGLVEDITLPKDNLRDLERHAAKKDSVLEILSHDLAAPLTNIQGLADALAESTHTCENTEEVNRLVRMIGDSAGRSVRLIREFVQLEFLESSRVDLLARRVELVSILEEVLEQYKGSEGRIKKRFTLTSNLPKVYAKVDQNKFMQVINNLFSNAIKFTEDGGEIHLGLEAKEDKVLITVKDDGIGIPERYHAHLFEKFSPARREGLLGEPSTGLGMSIIRTIVEWHRGRIWFESREGEGTTFYIELPS